MGQQYPGQNPLGFLGGEDLPGQSLDALSLSMVVFTASIMGTS